MLDCELAVVTLLLKLAFDMHLCNMARRTHHASSLRLHKFRWTPLQSCLRANGLHNQIRYAHVWKNKQRFHDPKPFGVSLLSDVSEHALRQKARAVLAAGQWSKVVYNKIHTYRHWLLNNRATLYALVACGRAPFGYNVRACMSTQTP